MRFERHRWLADQQPTPPPLQEALVQSLEEPDNRLGRQRGPCGRERCAGGHSDGATARAVGVFPLRREGLRQPGGSPAAATHCTPLTPTCERGWDGRCGSGCCSHGGAGASDQFLGAVPSPPKQARAYGPRRARRTSSTGIPRVRGLDFSRDLDTAFGCVHSDRCGMRSDIRCAANGPQKPGATVLLCGGWVERTTQGRLSSSVLFTPSVGRATVPPLTARSLHQASASTIGVPASCKDGMCRAVVPAQVGPPQLKRARCAQVVNRGA